MKFSFRLSDDSVMFSQGRWPLSSANIFYNIFFLKQKNEKKIYLCVETNLWYFTTRYHHSISWKATNQNVQQNNLDHYAIIYNHISYICMGNSIKLFSLFFVFCITWKFFLMLRSCLEPIYVKCCRNGRRNNSSNKWCNYWYNYHCCYYYESLL